MIPLTALLSGTGLRIALAGVALASAGVTGASLAVYVKNHQISALHQAYAEERSRAADAAYVALREVVQRSEQLSRQVAEAEAARQLVYEEKTHAIRRLTTGRRCLDSAAVRLLNDAPGLNPNALPAAAGQFAGAATAFASDTDVGLWAASARRAYDTCRGRLAAVARFYASDAASPATHPAPSSAPGHE